MLRIVSVVMLQGILQGTPRQTPTFEHLPFFSTFLRGEINKQSIGGRNVKQDFTFVSRVRIWGRHVEVEHGESPLLSLTLQHR